ncbi:pyridoxamine 5'-phosphate oxidase [Yunchengibacter salinarum]|uniref:pyridoxamine 5'-phosphate oxidase n=1 Tax=Yunchengibacter salinarum TaxID=3133399 RepID=UPI0035B6041E
MNETEKPFDAPFTLFGQWFAEAENSEINDPNAMALATAHPGGQPSLRMVLLKGYDPRGFVFYTNLDSRKGGEVEANGQAALLFHWKSLRRQVRIEGRTEIVPDAEADAYFHSRPRTSRIGAWASKQSRPMEGRFEFEKEIARYTAKFGASGEIPRPERWTGVRVIPHRFEFWRDRKYRLHDRHQYDLTEAGDGWTVTELYP